MWLVKSLVNNATHQSNSYYEPKMMSEKSEDELLGVVSLSERSRKGASDFFLSFA